MNRGIFGIALAGAALAYVATRQAPPKFKSGDIITNPHYAGSPTKIVLSVDAANGLYTLQPYNAAAGEVAWYPEPFPIGFIDQNWIIWHQV